MLSVLGAASQSIIMHGLALWWQATVMATSSMKCTVHKYIGLWFKIPSCLIRDILFTVKYMSRLQKPELIRNAKKLYSLSSLKCHSCYIVQCWPTPLITACSLCFDNFLWAFWYTLDPVLFNPSFERPPFVKNEMLCLSSEWPPIRDHLSQLTKDRSLVVLRVV